VLKIDLEELEKRAQIVADDSEGILPYCLAFYQLSIHYSAERCIESFYHYEEIKNQDVEPDYLVSVVQEAVGHAAALSRYFWPSSIGSKKQANLKILKEKRGENLRKIFQLNEDSPLYNRDLRNAWEHFDERLDVYLLENISGMFYPTCVIGSHTQADDPIGHIFKLLDPEAECLVLMGEKYFFAPIRNEVVRIFDHLYKDKSED
jgi:hypothetical protein